MEQNNSVPSANNGGDRSIDRSRRRKLRNDLIFIGSLLLGLILIGLAFFLLRGEGDTVLVTVDGESFGVYSLSKDTVVDIRTGEDGEHLNRLVIRDGKAFVELATCPDGSCADRKPISRQGESIVCLPHKVVISVRRTQTENAPDVVI